MTAEHDQQLYAKLSLIALSSTLFFTSIRHLYRFGVPALLFNAVALVLAFLLLWYRSTRSQAAVAIYALPAG